MVCEEGWYVAGREKSSTDSRAHSSIDNETQNVISNRFRERETISANKKQETNKHQNNKNCKRLRRADSANNGHHLASEATGAPHTNTAETTIIQQQNTAAAANANLGNKQKQKSATAGIDSGPKESIKRKKTKPNKQKRCAPNHPRARDRTRDRSKIYEKIFAVNRRRAS